MDRKRIVGALAWSLLLVGLVSCNLVVPAQPPTPEPTPTLTVGPAAIPSPSPMPTVEPPPSPTSEAIGGPHASPTRPPFPPRPEDFADFPPAVITYLNNSQGDVDGLREMLEDWEALRNVADLLRVDVDDDGKGELLLVIVNAFGEYGLNLAGDLLVVDIDGEKYSLAYRTPTEFFVTDPSLVEVDDVNRDGHTELAFTSTSCGAHTCFTTVYVLASGTGAYSDLTRGGITLSWAEPWFSDRDGDGVPELVMYGGTISSIGAGPQRAHTDVYRWDGAAYALEERIYDLSDYLYFKVVDANQALLEGQYEAAITLYRAAIENPELKIWIEEIEREELTAFARYRLSLTYLLLGETGQAETARDELLAKQPDSIYTEVVMVLWDSYLAHGDLSVACEAVGTFAAAHPETADVLANYGYSNPTFTAEEVCPAALF